MGIYGRATDNTQPELSMFLKQNISSKGEKHQTKPNQTNNKNQVHSEILYAAQASLKFMILQP